MSSSLEEMQRELVRLKVQRAVKQARQRREAGERDPAYDPTAGMGTIEKLAVGNTAGFKRGIQGLTNLVLPDSLTPEWASDERIAEDDRLNAPLKKTKAGFIGSLVGEVGSTLPIGGGSLGLAKFAKPGANVLTRALASTPGRGAVEGAVTGAALASPEERGEAAGLGATLGGGVGVLANVAGRLGRGIAQSSPETRNLQFLAAQHGEDAFVPVGQAVGDDADFLSRVMKSVYKEALPYTPGVSGAIRKQSGDLTKVFERTALKEAESGLKAVGYRGLTPAQLDNPGAAIKELRGAVNSAYKSSVKSRSYTLPIEKVQESMVRGQLRREFPHIDQTTLSETTAKALAIIKRFSDGKASIHGENLLNAKNEISKLIKRNSGIDKAALVTVNQMLETQIQRQTPGTLYDMYKAANTAHAEVRALERAVDPLGRFNPLQLLNKSAKSDSMKQVAGTFQKVVKDPLGLPGAAGRWIAAGATAGLGYLAPVPALTGLAVMHGLARKGTQKAVMGDTRLQRVLVKALNKDENARRLTGSALRAALTAQIGEE